MFGWCGTLLRVNLTARTIQKDEYSEYLRHNFVGGRV